MCATTCRLVSCQLLSMALSTCVDVVVSDRATGVRTLWFFNHSLLGTNLPFSKPESRTGMRASPGCVCPWHANQGDPCVQRIRELRRSVTVRPVALVLVRTRDHTAVATDLATGAKNGLYGARRSSVAHACGAVSSRHPGRTARSACGPLTWRPAQRAECMGRGEVPWGGACGAGVEPVPRSHGSICVRPPTWRPARQADCVGRGEVPWLASVGPAATRCPGRFRNHVAALVCRGVAGSEACGARKTSVAGRAAQHWVQPAPVASIEVCATVLATCAKSELCGPRITSVPGVGWTGDELALRPDIAIADARAAVSTNTKGVTCETADNFRGCGAVVEPAFRPVASIAMWPTVLATCVDGEVRRRG